MLVTFFVFAMAGVTTHAAVEGYAKDRSWTSSTGAKWILGNVGETCNTVCEKENRFCNWQAQSALNYIKIFQGALLRAGYYGCRRFRQAGYFGAPCYDTADGTCVLQHPSYLSVCDRVTLNTTRSLCYCDTSSCFNRKTDEGETYADCSKDGKRAWKYGDKGCRKCSCVDANTAGRTGRINWCLHNKNRPWFISLCKSDKKSAFFGSNRHPRTLGEVCQKSCGRCECTSKWTHQCHDELHDFGTTIWD